MSLRTIDVAAGLSDCPLPSGPKAAPYKWAPTRCGGSDENSQSLHIYLAPCGSPGYHFSALSFGGTAVLLAHDIKRSMCLAMSTDRF